MASKCFYLILHSVLFFITVFVVQVYCDSAGYYLVENAQQQDFDATFIPLSREKRHPGEKKSVDPEEDKSKVTKKPTYFDAKSINIVPAEKSGIGVNKKELKVPKATNATQSDSEKDNVELKLSKEPDGVSPPSHLANSSSPIPTAVTTLTHTSMPTIASSAPSTTMPSILTPTPSVVAKVNQSTVEHILPHLNISTSDHDVQITEMFDTNFNETLKKYNISTQKQDHHLYYNSSFVVDPEMVRRYWVDLDKHSDTKVSDILSQAYRRAMTVKLSFDFPFYGHPIRNITIATGGFLFTGEYVHSWLAMTQYIAPLMANFDTTLSNHSFVKYLDNGTAFTVQWENVILQEKQDKGGFTFQCTLLNNGDIIFVYQQVAVVIEEINDDQHPVKIGLSDAYIIDRTIFFIRKKTIYEYHSVNFQKQDIKNWTVIVLNALDTCLDMKDCHSCLSHVEKLECKWCGNRCSNGMDRHRQDWITNGCDKTKLKAVDECIVEVAQPHNESVFGILGILFLICLLLGIGMWFFYAYRNPHTPAGQFLIRYRPSQWSWRRGEARYTAATIHM